jgi:hypothetical protein
VVNAVNISDIVEANGKTIRQNNLEQKHKYPIGTLVEFEWDDNCSYGSSISPTTVKAFVCQLTRDCDGTPLYTMSMWPPETWPSINPRLTHEAYANDKFLGNIRTTCDALFQILFHNYGEDSLKEVK